MNAADKTQRIPNTTFEIRRVSDGGLVDTVTTGTDGRVYVPLESGSYYAVETEAGKGFQLDNTPIYFEMCIRDRPTTGQRDCSMTVRPTAISPRWQQVKCFTAWIAAMATAGALPAF